MHLPVKQHLHLVCGVDPTPLRHLERGPPDPDVMGDQIVLAYSMIGLVIVLHVAASVSLAFPQWVDVSDLNMFF